MSRRPWDGLRAVAWGPPERLKIPRAKALAMAANAGLVLDGERPKLLPYQTFMVLRKP